MAAKPKPDPRKMMELAIHIMRQSVPERRQDGKPSPKVGAVLVRPDGSLEWAARGELREGNHAEFTLLERKCPGEKLDDCILFATLEPCLDRNPPKCGCARHIVNARIKEVYVGIEDDNPAVAGKGFEYLRQHGVTVHLFDRDLQEVIQAENKTFFDWARQQVEKPKEEPVKLSKYEDSLPAVELKDLSPAALKYYHSRVPVGAAYDSEDFRRLLRQQGILVEVDGATVPSGFGLILFGNDPSLAMPQARLLARAELADGTCSRMEFNDALVLVPEKLAEWLNKILPSTLDRNQMERRERVDLPFVMVREAVVNALIHRNYDIPGQKCQLVVTSETITIKSPGGPIPPVTLEQMRSFSAPMKSRNPILHYVFARLGMAEEQGFGLSSLKAEAERLGLPLPSYTMEGDSLVLTIYRSKAAATAVLGADVLKSLNKDDKAAWELISGQQSVSSPEVQEKMGFDERKAQRVLKKLVEAGLLRPVGRGRATRYKVSKS